MIKFIRTGFGEIIMAVSKLIRCPKCGHVWKEMIERDKTIECPKCKTEFKSNLDVIFPEKKLW
jgi:uncharacterized C2H2 Zn-finger protein